MAANDSLATEPKQDAVLEKQDESNAIADAVQELASRLAFLPTVRGVAADLRVTLLSGVVTSVTTVAAVTSVTGITNIGGIPAVQLIPSNQNMAAILSNINNVVIT